MPLAYADVVEVTWDPAKDAANRKRHGVSFTEAAELFTSGADYLVIFDDTHSIEEDRFWAVGPIRRGLILVVHTEQDENTIRIISARWASKQERGLFAEYWERRHE